VGSSAQKSPGGGGKQVAPRTFAVGDRCAKYLIVGFIDQGGMGEVYDARDEYLNRRVALKVARVRHHGKIKFAAGQRKEAQVLAELDHPNIVRLYDAGITQDGLMYMAMEYVAGRSLRFLLSWEGRFDLRTTLSTATQIADALRVAHKIDIIHRDLKPENVIMQRSGQIKVIDFGIAMRLATVEHAPSTDPFPDIMTVNYAAPEQALGHGAGTWSDVYAFGILLFEMTTGAHPFAFAEGEPPTPRSRGPDRCRTTRSAWSFRRTSC
jgi:eukaryotic-like serine/threonine-protein kinase